MKQIKLKITGMHCNSCKILITDILKENELNIKSFEKEIVILEYDENKISIENILSEIKNEGYEGSLLK